ncbi:MAG: hypothetical protein IPF68_16815 [Bacteroidales bacterium]|nr:hypothetical protein [Bacteroidales bacterium]
MQGASGTATVVIAVPVGASLGITRMSVRGGDDSQPTSAQACGASGSAYGQAHDYLVNIIPATAPALSVDPTSISFGSVVSGGTSIEYSYSLTGLNLDPPAGEITIIPPTNFEVSEMTGGPYSSDPINVSYFGGILNTTIYVVFRPTTSNTLYSGNIANSGGGASSISVALTGISPCDAMALPVSEDFNAVTTPNLPDCWTKKIVSTSSKCYNHYNKSFFTLWSLSFKLWRCRI